MNKNMLVIGAIIILVAAIAYIYFNDEKTGCDWRPKTEGPCQKPLAYYYDGEKCKVDSSCDYSDTVQFITLEECKASCEK